MSSLVNIRGIWLLSIAAVSLFEFALSNGNEFSRKDPEAVLSLQLMFLACAAVWCCVFVVFNFSRKDWLLVSVLVSALVYFFYASGSQSMTGMTMLLFGVTFGKSVRLLLPGKAVRHKDVNIKDPGGWFFLIGLVAMLAFSSCWRLKMHGSYYHGLRRTGLWDNPNTYGMLMAAGAVLAIGLISVKNAEVRRWKARNVFLCVVTFMLAAGLVMSCSRGAVLATAVGLLYLAWTYDKLRWRYLGPGLGLVALGGLFLWGQTSDSAPWYVKRADLGRPSAQHRVSAWRAGLEIMRDHPLGVGWNNAASLYEKSYSPPEGGAIAITTNDYMMIGTELGIPALLCFMAYVALCYGKSPRIEASEVCIQNEPEALRAACLSGALVFVVAFWFDGGLFKLPTATLFWVLLELGSHRPTKISSLTSTASIASGG